MYNLKTFNAMKAFITLTQGVIVTARNIPSQCQELCEML